MRQSNAVEEGVEPQRESVRDSNKTRKISILRMSERAFLRWNENRVLLKEEMISVEIAARVWTRGRPERSTGDKKASRDGDLLRRRDENIAAVAIDFDSVSLR